MYRLIVKKTYCPACKKLVKGIEQGKPERKKVICSTCNRDLWKRNGLNWRSCS